MFKSLDGLKILTFDEVNDDLCNNEDMYRRLLDLRGGCNCPAGWPPCFACSSPLTESEAEELGYEPAYGGQSAEVPTPKSEADRLWAVTRALCQ